jgi:hypothetical protein
MAAHTRAGKALVDTAEQLKQEMAKATDFQKLFKDNQFLEKLQKLPQMEQLKIFEQYKDKFNEISKNPGSAITKWTSNLTKNLPNIDAAQNILNNGTQQGQNLVKDFKNSLDVISRSSPK